MIKRQKNPKSEFQKQLQKVRQSSPSHLVEIELQIEKHHHFKMMQIGEQLRLIRNTVLGEIHKKYKQMVRAKEYKRTLKRYRIVSNELKKGKKSKPLIKEKQDLVKKFEELRSLYDVTFNFARKYGEELRKTTYTLPDAVTVWSIAEMVWQSIEGLLYGKSQKPYFYKKSDFITFKAKQAERCIILKENTVGDTLYISFNKMNLPLKVKVEDLLIQETLSNISLYMKNSDDIDKQNVELFKSGKPLISTYRIRNNRIIRKLIRGKVRYYV